ncbi:DUF262 domain-containing protein [Cryobacterium psychrophilum]|uniref:DUF262 domain-containing protein n=1 Tax=Cryobacterium psychrophilum TaxID=41988 RepID=A0A4Y8KTG6_9MICO|nr:DUF262 domain-containing protein [Cryobacterium psychrophilum]TDW31089.1 uncharacterized protein with ParB-like and HNH nuclease domain [Cryobacterium psychrophilum]TFD78610.1 DUF262 domain-containing protein [Cryobacterium psychrophilum]
MATKNLGLNLTEVIDGRLFTIADYQRPFSWGEKQLGDLWEDLDLMGGAGSHYAGTLVLRPVADVADDRSELRQFEVIDGQQRLTTCFLILDRIRRRLEALGALGLTEAIASATEIRDNFGFVTIDFAPQPRIRLGKGLDEYWTKSVLNDEPFHQGSLIAGQRRLREAVTFVEARLARLVTGSGPQESFRRLSELHRRIAQGLGFLVYEVGSSAEAGVIFETVNERGRDLSELEKAKNYLLYLASSIPDGRGEQLANLINSAWAQMFQNLAREGVDADNQLLRVHWLATVDPDFHNWVGAGSLKKRFDRSKYIATAMRIVSSADIVEDQTASWGRLSTDITDYVSSLRDSSFILREMSDPQAAFESFENKQEKEQARLNLAALSRTRIVAPYRPLLLAARLRHPQNGAFYAELADLCERYSARVFVIEQRRANAGSAGLARIAHKLYRGIIGPSDAIDQVTALLWRYAPDGRLATTLYSTEEDWYGRRGHKYFLYEYERSLWGSRPGLKLPAFTEFSSSQASQRTTEHILPQHPRRGRGWSKFFTSRERALLVNSLGNLILTLDNSVYSDKGFAGKRGIPGQVGVACYANGRLQQERALAAFVNWTPETIAARQQSLAAWAMERWAVTAPSSMAITATDDDDDGEEEVEDEAELEIEVQPD